MQSYTSKRIEKSILWGSVFIDLLIIVGTLFFLLHSRSHFLEGLSVVGHNLVQLLEQRIADKARLVDDAVVRVERELEEQLRGGAIDPQRLQWLLNLEQEQLPEIDAIRVTNAQGKVIWGKGVISTVNATYADRAFFKAHQEKHTHESIVTPPLKGKVSGLWVVAFTRCYRYPDGRFAGVISAAVPTEIFSRILSNINLGPTGTAALRSTDGGLVARMPPLDGAVGQPGNKKISREYLQILNSNISVGNFQTRTSPDSVARTYAFRRVMGWPFTIAVGLVESEYLAPWRVQAIWGTLLLGILLLMTSTLSWVTIRHLRQQGIREKEREEDLTRRRILIDQSRDGIVILDSRGKVYEANRHFAEMLGYSPEEIKDLYLWQWDARWTREELESMLSGVGNNGAYLKTRHRRKDGRIIDVEISANGADFGGNKLVFCVCRDVSEQNKARDALRVSEEKYRIIFENQLYAVAIFDLLTLRFLDVNQAYIRMYGYSREELLDGMTILDVSAEPERSEHAVSQAVEQGAIFIPLRYHRKKDGSVIPVEIVGGPYNWDGCRVMFMLGHDISARKQAEDDLRGSEELYRFLVTSLSDGFFSCDNRGIISFANKALAQMHGVEDPECLLGRHIFDFIAPVDLERVEAHFNEALAHHIVPVSLEIMLVREGGMNLWVEVKPTVVTRDQGLVSIQGLVIDITQRKKAAEALQKSEERLHLALQATKDAIWDWDFLAGTMYYSPRWFMMAGYTSEELQVDPELWLRLMHPDDLERAKTVVSEAIVDKTFFEIETRLLHKAGYYVPILTRGYILRNDAGKTIRLAGTNTDLSEQQRIEEERREWERQAFQLQKAESLSRMAGAIAHHFNNLLSVVLGNIEITLEDLPADQPVVANLRAASQAGDRAVEVSSLLLTYLGQTEGRHELLDLGRLYRQSLVQIQALLKEEIVLETRFPKNGPLVRGNGTLLQRMLKNLIVNAAEAIGERQGHIGLSLTVIALSDIPSAHRFPLDWEPAADHYVCLQIQDSGDGIEAADIEQLFDPFFSSKFTGRGLGLSVVMGIVRSHSGGITVASTREQGSVFQVYIPLVEREALPDQQGVGDERAAAIERTVLLVEDEEQVRLMTESMLSRLGFAYLSAEDGAEALALFKRHADRIALVICDLSMPNVGGWETMETIKEIAPTIPFVMTSGYDETRVMREGRKLYPQVFLQKPYKKDELGAAIEAAFKHVSTILSAGEHC
ncbi:MAG: PAS domain S-box protein [Desulfobulbus sp.]|nr:PAS domain S-box protein [Desulfobulbus sp.]